MTVRHAQAGFTLVELLAVLLVGALLLVSLGGMIATFGQQAHLSDDDAKRIEDTTQTEAVLRRLVESASPGLQRFSGTPAQATMIVAAPHAIVNRGSVRLTLAFDRQAGALTARFAPLGRAPLPTFAQAPVVLFDKVQGAHFRYTGKQEFVRRTASDWPLTAARPSLIELTLEPMEGDPYTIVFTPRVQADGACGFDTVSLGCGA